MNWDDILNGDSLNWLLEFDSPGVRYLALRDIVRLSKSDPQLETARARAHKEGPIATILDAMNDEGFWIKPGPGYRPKYRSTVWAIILLAQLGATIDEDERIGVGCEYLLDNALTKGGLFSISGAPSYNVDCLQGNLCWALTELNYQDERLALAYEWMSRSVTGIGVSPFEDKRATRRYYSGNIGPNFACGANNKMPCAWGASKVMMAYGSLPKQQRTDLINQAISQGKEFIFSVDPAKADYPSGLNPNPSRNWWKFGFPVFYITDLLQLVEGMVNLESGDDPRLKNAAAIILAKQDDLGRWPLEYSYRGKTWSDFGEIRQPNKWVTLRVLRTLEKIFSQQPQFLDSDF